jgi:hypothetical protein
MPIAGPGCRNASARVRRLVGEPRHHRQRSRAAPLAGLTMSVVRGRPEVAFRGRQDRF